MYTPSINPQPFGPVTVSTPGTPVAICSKLYAMGLAVPGDIVEVNKISVIAMPANTGKVYVGVPGMNKTTLAGVLYVFASGNAAWEITNNVGGDTYRFDKFLIDADVAGEGVYGAIDQV